MSDYSNISEKLKEWIKNNPDEWEEIISSSSYDYLYQLEIMNEMLDKVSSLQLIELQYGRDNVCTRAFTYINGLHVDVADFSIPYELEKEEAFDKWVEEILYIENLILCLTKK